jgi:hypothetical protein
MLGVRIYDEENCLFCIWNFDSQAVPGRNTPAPFPLPRTPQTVKLQLVKLTSIVIYRISHYFFHGTYRGRKFQFRATVVCEAIPIAYRSQSFLASGKLTDIINRVKFCIDRLRGFGLTVPENRMFP